MQLESKSGIQLGGENDTTNLQFFGVNSTSTNCQDMEVFVSGGVLGEFQQGDYEIYSKSNKLFANSAEINAPHVKIHSTDRYKRCDNQDKVHANKLDINASNVHIGWIAADNN